MNTNDAADRRSLLRILQQRLREDKRSDSQIARSAQVSQPTVSRLRGLTKQRVRWSEPFNKLCIMYDLGRPKRATEPPDYNALLQAAIAAAWDGTPDTGRNLLALIEAINRLTRHRAHGARSSHGRD